MPDPAPNPELLRSLGRLARGLSALFWGLPVALLVCAETARAEWLKPLGILPAIAVNALLLYALRLMSAFQKQERIWRNALDGACMLSLINLGLSPFLYWWNKVPGQPFFLAMVVLMQICALLFVGSLNLVLRRLGAMLPDEALRLDIKLFTTLNLNLLSLTFLFGLAAFLVGHAHELPLHFTTRNLPFFAQRIVGLIENNELWLPLPLLLLPLATTMALLWKTKEVILDSVFGSKREGH